MATCQDERRMMRQDVLEAPHSKDPGSLRASTNLQACDDCFWGLENPVAIAPLRHSILKAAEISAAMGTVICVNETKVLSFIVLFLPDMRCGFLALDRERNC